MKTSNTARTNTTIGFCAAPFDALAPSYDETFTYSIIGRAQREAITRELDATFRPGQYILELNCGTGVDAIYLSRRGVKVVACDISSAMIQRACHQADQAAQDVGLRVKPSFRVLATEEIGELSEEGFTNEFDGALSNFAGLNCVTSLRNVARDLARLLKPGAQFLLCIFGRFCAWESLWYLAHGKPSKAFRRFRGQGSVARLAESATVTVHYPSVREWARIFSPEFKLKKWSGIGLTVPPTYLETLARRFPKLLEASARVDRRIGHLPPMRGLADHRLLIFERRAHWTDS